MVCAFFRMRHDYWEIHKKYIFVHFVFQLDLCFLVVLL